MKRVLLIIDPQNSFCDAKGELCVPEAHGDMKRLAAFIDTQGHLFSRIVVTLDSHNRVHIAHPIWWINEKGEHPAPFTALTHEEVKKGLWRAAEPENEAWSLHYLEKSEPHIIWPPHCIMGTWGHAVYPPLNDTLHTWALAHKDLVFKPKGHSAYTEHFSIFSPRVERKGDPSTAFDMGLLNDLDLFDEIYVAGEAASHCVADSVKDMVRVRPKMAPKTTLLADAMSPVSGFEDLADTFFAEIKKAGMKTALTTESITTSNPAPNAL